MTKEKKKMTQKRTATSEINRDNWEDEDVPEEMGTYKTASASDLKMRSIKVAKRRGVTGSDEGVSVFKNFKGFGTANSESTPAFSFLTDDSKKPKLICSNSFPSFSFGKSSDSSKENDDKVKDSGKTSSSEKPSIPTFSFTSKSKGNSTDPTGIGKEPASKPSFKFGVDIDKTSDKSDKAMLSSFNFNPSKSTDNDHKKTEEKSFKFGVNPIKKKVTNSSTNAFQFGSQSLHKIDSVSSPALGGRSKSNDSGCKEPKLPNVNGIKSSPESESKKSNLFLANLKALNLGVLKWVQQHLDKNQYINLTPIFEDYKDHFQEIKKKFDNSESKCSDEDKPASILSLGQKFPGTKDHSISSTSTSLFNFGSSNAKGNKSESLVFSSESGSKDSQKISSKDKVSESSKMSEAKPCSFGINTDSSKKGNPADSSNKTAAPRFTFGEDNHTPSLTFNTADSKPAFSFASSESKNSTADFSFASSKDSKPPGFSFLKNDEPAPSFSFIPNHPEANADKDKKDEKECEPSDEVPTENVIQVKEDDAVYEKKVKLFYRKGDQYPSIGVGTLFLKPVGEKTQLIVRTQTNLGVILLNIFLYESTPTQRVGKNNVMLVCVPNPPIDAKAENTPVSILVRVKTDIDADELLEQINKYKK